MINQLLNRNSISNINQGSQLIIMLRINFIGISSCVLECVGDTVRFLLHKI